MADTIRTTPIRGEGDDQAANVFPNDRYLQAVTSPYPYALTPNEKRDARRLIAKFLKLSEDNRAKISYTQARPFDISVYPNLGYRGDCSSYPSQAWWYAWDILDGVPLHDPNGYREYDGWGFTGTLLATNHSSRVPLDRKFFVGDVAIFGTFYNTHHATVCRKNGVEADAIFSSHGTQIGPLPTRLRYRKDLLGVYRPMSLL